MDFYSMNLAAGMSGGGGGGSSNVVIVSATPGETDVTINTTVNEILALTSAHKFIVVEAVANDDGQLMRMYGYLASIYAGDHGATVAFNLGGTLETSVPDSDYDQPIVLSW